MTLRLRRSWIACALFLMFGGGAAACRSSGAAQGFPTEDVAAPSEVSGAFEFTANLPGRLVTGSVAVLPDTIILELSDGYCKVAPQTAKSPRGASFQCVSGLTIWIDKYSTQAWSWTAFEHVMRTRRVCVDYVTYNGRRVCAREVNERYTVPVERRGRLNVRPRGGSPVEGKVQRRHTALKSDFG